MSNTVPEGWTIATLEQIALDKKGAIVDGPFGSNLKTSDYVAEGVPVLQGKNITHDKFRWSDVRFITPAKAKDLIRSSVRVGDILLIKIGSVGYSAIVDNLNGNNFAIIPANLMKLSVDESRNSTRFVHHYLTSPEGRGRIIDAASSTAQPALSLSTVKKFKIPRPPLPEQQKIAAILSSVDDVIEKTRAQIDKLKDLKTGMMQELLTKGIGSGGVPHTEFKDSPVGRIPTAWKVAELRDLLGFISYGFTNPMPEAETGPFMVTAKDVSDLSVQYDSARKTTTQAYNELLTEKSRPKINDILLTKDGTLGRVALVERTNICINQSVAVLRPNEKVIPKFLLYLLASPPYQREMLDKAGGSTIKHIYITVVDKMKVAVPTMCEQEKIVEVLDALFRKISLAEEKLRLHTATKKALMQDLLTGKVRVKIDQKESAVS